MSYQVLARKWRPQTFHQLVGQSHVRQALINALTQNRLHHAYLFTGTRGVGKTTIARIFAKSLNCDEGISAEPCGKCSSCTDIEAGRYIDLLEIDAASRTKVEDTREILDNVQYAPTRGRYKVYLIDEVHMLSKHSFNALLKTLEEPPEHVKFLLATTDPQKLPVTILSRCLQFNLNALSQPEIKQQLEFVLDEEKLSYDSLALQIIAKSADGSMRDALSLTDQAIAQTNGDINHQAVQAMLGLMDTHYSQHMLAALLAQDGKTLLDEIAAVATKSPNYPALLDDLIALTHVIQLTQLVPSAAELDEHNQEFVEQVAASCDAKQIQVYYQLLLNGKKDLHWAPEPRLGFEMVLLRLLAFEPSEQLAQAPINNNSLQQSVEVKQQRASSLRDIINKNKNKPQSNEIDVHKADENKAPTSNESISINTQQVHDIADAQVNDVQIADNYQANNVANSDNETDIEANELLTESSPSIDEATIASQFDDVMSQATEQGFQQQPGKNETDSEPQAHDSNLHGWSETESQNAEPHNLETEMVSPADTPVQFAGSDVAQKEAQAQSAIARILRDRNISGTGTLSGAKIEPTSVQASTESEDSSPKKPQPQQKGAGQKPIANKTAKVDFKQKHQTITENLATELLEQINPQKTVDKVESEPQIPVPDDFESPISSIKFAHEQDEWAYLIKRMGLGGRMRQFALHSIFNKNDLQLRISVDSSQKHLDSPVLRQKLDAALSEIYNRNVELTIEFAQGVIDSPFLIQQKIDAGRHQQAIDVINSDNNIVQFKQLFSAEIDENSIQAL